MRKIVLSILFLAFVFHAAAISMVSNQGHRGTGSNVPGNDYPENTIPSLLQAFTEGADSVELDTQLSLDDEVIVIHDSTMDRTTDCTGNVRNLTLAEIQSCDAAVGTLLEGQSVIVPTLAEVFSSLEYVKDAAIVNVEIKGSGVSAAHMAQRVTSEIVVAGWEDHVIISSFNSDILSEVEAIDHEWVTALITSELNVNAQADIALGFGFDGLHPYFLNTFASNIAYAHNLGLFVNVWTLDIKAIMKLQIENGVDGIITNEPDRLYDVLNSVDDDDDDFIDDDDDDDIVDDDDNDTSDDDAIDDDDQDDDDNTTEAGNSNDDDDSETCCG